MYVIKTYYEEKINEFVSKKPQLVGVQYFKDKNYDEVNEIIKLANKYYKENGEKLFCEMGKLL